ncbi:MAG: hypothetical protein ACKO86_16150, partial [Dolichospermum sp.]
MFFSDTFNLKVQIYGFLCGKCCYHQAIEGDKTETIMSLYQISLDGPKEIHDQSRIRADGKSTFERIWNNLLAIRDSSLPFSILLRLHFNPDTFNFFDPLLEDIKREFLPDSRFSILFKSIEHL